MTPLQSYSLAFAAMSTDCRLRIYAGSASVAECAILATIEEVGRIESRYSRYQPLSDLSQINLIAKAGGSVSVDDETAGLLNYAFAAYHRSQGLFDITSGLLRQAWDFRSDQLPAQDVLDRLLPFVGLDKVQWLPPRLSFAQAGMEIDLGGIGKEYAADRAAAICMAAGIEHGLIDLGGDIRVIGPHPDGQPWQIGIRHPRHSDQWMGAASLCQGAIATSGDYERCITIDGRRYGHILDPRTGWPVQQLCSVSVIANECLLAGTLCTTAMLKGNEGPAWLKSLGVPHLSMDEWGDCQQTNWPGSNAGQSLAVACCAQQ